MRKASVAGKGWKSDVIGERGQTRCAPYFPIPVPVAGSIHGPSKLTSLCCSNKPDHITPISPHLTPCKRSLEWLMTIPVIKSSLCLTYSTGSCSDYFICWPLGWYWMEHKGTILAQTMQLAAPLFDILRTRLPSSLGIFEEMGPSGATCLK